MVRKTNDQTERAQINDIADQWAETGEYPAGVSETVVQELGQTLFDQLETRINTFVAETTLTRREAEVWVLSTHADKHYHLLTETAIALLLSTPTTGFGDTNDTAEEPTTTQSATPEAVEHYFADAEKKIDDAEQTIGAVTFPDRDDVLTSPKLVWLDRSTVYRLKDQRGPDEDTLDDVITRCLDETETQLSLEEFARGYLNARGKDNVAQLAVERQSFETGALTITAHTPVQDDLPDIVTETDAITHHGHRYDFHFDEDPYGPHDTGRITLYASDTIVGMDETPLEDGLAAADDHMQDLLERKEPLPSRTVA